MKWDLTAIYKNEKEFEKDFEELKKLVEKITSYKGELKNKLEEYFVVSEQADLILEDLYVYSRMSFDLDLSNNKNEARLKRINNFVSVMREKISFVEPEILEIDKKYIDKLISSSKVLKEYKYTIDDLFRSKEHVLDEKSEKLLSYFSLTSSSGRDLYNALRTSDQKIKKVKVSSGKTIDVSNQNYGLYLASLTEQNDRKKVFEKLYKFFEDYKNTFANLYVSIVNNDIAYSKARNYNSLLENALFYDNVPEAVYLNLIKVARNSKNMARYNELRKKILGLKNYYNFDRAIPLVEINSKYTYEEAKQIIFEAIRALPDDYQEKVKKVLSDGYVDVKPNKNKKIGAYSWGTYRSHTYILLNFNGKLGDVLTVAHEAGHSVHTMYSNENQSYPNSDHSIFVAEVASIFLESVVINYLYNKVKTKKEKIFLLQNKIDGAMAAFYRQAMFADFEYQVHSKMFNGEVFTENELSALAIELYKDYYGMDIKGQELKRYWWAYIPHLFNTPFYVYKYATCYTITNNLFDKYKKDNNIDSFINLLKAGGSDYAFSIVKDAGVDLSRKDAYDSVNEEIGEMLDELEKLTN